MVMLVYQDLSSLFVWYDDGQPMMAEVLNGYKLSVELVNKVSQVEFKSSYTFIAPIDLNGDNVSFDIDLLQELPAIMALELNDLFYCCSGGDEELQDASWRSCGLHC